MSNDAINGLLEKLNVFQETLSDEEHRAFAGMIELAAQSAEELSEEDLDNVAGGRMSGGEVSFKTQSAHSALMKTQSAHDYLSREAFDWLIEK